MFTKTYLRSSVICALLTGAQFFSSAQTNPDFFAGATAESRRKMYANATAGIVKELSLPLNKENEAEWADAFASVNSFKYETAFVNAKIDQAVAYMNKASREYQKALLQLLNSDYPKKYYEQVKYIFFHAADDIPLTAMAAHYMLSAVKAVDIEPMKQYAAKLYRKNFSSPVMSELNYTLQTRNRKEIIPSLQPFFDPAYLPEQVLVLSFQRKNRDFPGIAVVRKADGSFFKNEDGSYFHIGQLARSEGNMPGYISMGNTPQGIFRMDGFDTSKIFAIGPTTNIQLTMPFEFKASHFFRDSSMNDTVWYRDNYASLLPAAFRNYHPVYGTYYAGEAGRNEIIAHGTTISPAYFSGRSYYPYSPSAGCLVAKEIWNEKTGLLAESDQLRLSDAVKKAGGANGYLIVIEINDISRPVQLEDILKYLP